MTEEQPRGRDGWSGTPRSWGLGERVRADAEGHSENVGFFLRVR